MLKFNQELSSHYYEKDYAMEDYESNVPRWCTGCGDNTILTALQKLCAQENLPPEKTVFVSGIGCSSRFPHYMKTYGFHSLHGRALPIAEGVKIRRPDLNVFVNTGDGDCCSIGASHWIHAIRYNMNLTVMMHDNRIYGLTKMQVSPTSPAGLKTNTTPSGAYLRPLNPISTTLSVTNVSFVAQAVDWYFDPFLQDPNKTLLLRHKNGLELSAGLAGSYKNQIEHDPMDLNKARELAVNEDEIPVGILYRNEEVPCYEDLRKPEKIFTPVDIENTLNDEFNKFAVEPMQ